jgi:hypothetical protein
MKKYNRIVIIIITIAVFLSSVNTSYAMYDPTTGRFNRMDPFTGKKEIPQSLHKYAYCQNDPVNNIDPSGLMGCPSYEIMFSMANRVKLTEAEYVAKAPIITKVVAAAAILAVAGAQVYSGGLIDDPQGLVQDNLDQAVAQRQVIAFAMQHTSRPLSQEDFNALERQLSYRKRRGTNEVPLFLHYGFKETGSIFKTGAGLKAPSWGTKQVYPTGWHAKYYLSLYNEGPRNSIYIVLPGSYDTFYYGGTARPKQDSYPPNVGNWLRGGGQQWFFPQGTSPGTVIGPIPLPEGNLSDIPGGN